MHRPHPLIAFPLTAFAYACAYWVGWMAMSRALRHPHGALEALRHHRLG